MTIESIDKIVESVRSEFEAKPHVHENDCRSCEIKHILRNTKVKYFIEGQLMAVIMGETNGRNALMDMICLGFEIAERLQAAEKLQEVVDRT